MSSSKKKIAKIIRNPKNVTYEILVWVLKEFGWTTKKQKQGGGSSHHPYRKEGEYPITVPYKRPFVGEVYVKEVIDRLDLKVWYEENN